MTRGWVPRCACGLALVFLGGASFGDEPQESPYDSGLVERARRALVQLDVTVHGAAEVVPTLTAEDFVLELDGRKVRDFVVDRLCAQRSAGPDATAPQPLPGLESTAAGSPSYLFYFDQHHLTVGGRARSLELARELVHQLVPAGRATIVSAGSRIRTFAPLTSDGDLLLAALDRLENDDEQWDTYPTSEDRRVEEVQQALEYYMDGARLSSNTDARTLKQWWKASCRERKEAADNVNEHLASGLMSARTTARAFQKEEWSHTERALSQFSSALVRMASYDSPKAVIYFADTMRANAGEHYLGLVGEMPEMSGTYGVHNTRTASRIAPVGESSTTTVPSFDWAIEEASAYGIRLYTVQAEGLVARSMANRSSNVQNAKYEGSPATAAAKRFSDAESSLVTFAAETGGQSFLRGVKAGFIAGRIRDDLACLYVLSFDPGDLPQDRMLPVRVDTRRSGVQTHTRARLVVRSESSRLASRLLAAFAAPDDSQNDNRLAALVIPTGFEQHKYTALVQVTVPGTSLPQVDWDIGVSVVSRGTVRQKASGRISVHAEQVPVVFETTVTIAPGPWELTAVAHETVKDEIVTGRIEGAWPDPTVNAATIGPITLLQPMRAAFLRDGSLRREGSLGRREGQPIRSDLPTALVGIVCRQHGRSSKLRVERRLAGEDFVDFPVVELGAGKDRCAILSDVIPAGTMSAGMFQYELRVHDSGGDLASAAREFAALTPE